MRRARRIYFTFLVATLVFFSLGAALPAAEGGAGWGPLFHFLILCAGAGCAVGTWGTGVMIASVYKVTWPLMFSTGIVVAGGITFALIGHRAAL